jgi:hypothetical protein
MPFHPGHESGLAAVDIQATAFRDDHSAELVTITQLSFDRCELSSNAKFEVGERLRLLLPKQGWIEAEVRSAMNGRIEAFFVTRCNV